MKLVEIVLGALAAPTFAATLYRAVRGASLATMAGAIVLGPCASNREAPAPPTSAAHATATASLPRRGLTDVSLTVRCDAPDRRISPLIYGVGQRPMHDTADPWSLYPTARRWGGNHTSRYNWEHGNAWNTGKDWFFENVDYDRSPIPAYRRFIDESLAHHAVTALTVPTIGWVAKDTTSYGFPVSIHGPQSSVAPENLDVGNGIAKNGHLVIPGPPERTSVPMPPEGVARWVRTLRDQERARGTRGVTIYVLDNEPTLWSETHRDVHPEPVSYDELLERTVAYAAAIRRADPDALIAGPALWGFPALFSSAVDTAARPRHPDRDKHGNIPLLPWWLANVRAAEARLGVRLVDLADVHFYPQGRGIGVAASGDTDPETAARRIRATRALWDESYVDESWIGDKIRLIPRLEEWIAENHPGLGIAIGEYNFGAEEHMSGGLAVAEALGRFAEHGVTAAFYWDYPPVNSPAYWAFRGYRDFDGAGGHFLDRAVQARSPDESVSILASRDENGEHAVVVLLDLDPAHAFHARVDLSTCGAIETGHRFVYTGAREGFARADLDIARGSLSPVLLAPWSITVLDLHFRHPR
jgi:hypothetical protein